MIINGYRMVGISISIDSSDDEMINDTTDLIATKLEAIAKYVSSGDVPPYGESRTIRDTNGNNIGTWSGQWIDADDL